MKVYLSEIISFLWTIARNKESIAAKVLFVMSSHKYYEKIELKVTKQISPNKCLTKMFMKSTRTKCIKNYFFYFDEHLDELGEFLTFFVK